MKNKLYKSFLSVTSISIITRLISFALHVYISRVFGALNIGIFSIASSVFFMFSCFASSGFPVTLSRKIAYYDALNDNEHSSAILTSTLIITTAISTTICLFFTLFPSSLNLLFSNPKCHGVFKILLPTLISTSIYATFRAWFWGKQKYTLYSMLELLDEIFLLFGVLIVYFCKFHKNTPYLQFALANDIGDIFCVITIILLFIFLGGKINKPKYAQEIALSSLPITTTRILGSLMSSVIALMLPALLVKHGLTLDFATAEYGRMSSMVIPIALAPGTIISSLIVVLIPDISALVAKNGNSSANKKITFCILFSCIIACSFMSIFICSGKDIAILFFNDTHAGELLQKTTLIILPLVLNQLSSSILNTLGKENSTFLTSLISSFGLIATLLIFAKKLGILAYPLSLLVYHLISLTINTIQLKKTTNISLQYLAKCIFLFLIAFLIGYFVSLMQKSYQDFNIFARLVISCLIILILLMLFYLPIFIKLKKNKVLKKQK